MSSLKLLKNSSINHFFSLQIVRVTLLKVSKKNGNLQYDKQMVNLMGPMDDKRDGFDILIDHAPEKLPFVKQSLIKFANSHLANIGNEY